MLTKGLLPVTAVAAWWTADGVTAATDSHSCAAESVAEDEVEEWRQ